MCFGSSGSKAAERESALARAEEEARQAEIRAGRASINAVFDGGVFDPTPRGYTPQAGNTYYRADGSVYTPPAPTPPPAAAQAPSTPLDRIRNGVGGRDDDPRSGIVESVVARANAAPSGPQEQLFRSKRDGFATDEFFANNRKAFEDFALPQLDQQFGDASKELSFDLARSGLLNSSVRGEQSGRLQRLYDQNKQQVTNEALSREQQQRTSVEDARSNLIAMLQTTGDAQGAANQALSRASILSAPQPFQPLGQLFTDFTAGLGTQAAMERAASVSGGRYSPRYNTGLFGAPSSAVQNRT